MSDDLDAFIADVERAAGWAPQPGCMSKDELLELLRTMRDQSNPMGSWGWLSTPWDRGCCTLIS